MTRQAVGEMSMPIHCRERFSAATSAVPHPQKASRTMSFGLLLALMIRSKRASGFCVGKPSLSPFLLMPRSISMSSHQLCSGTPMLSSR